MLCTCGHPFLQHHDLPTASCLLCPCVAYVVGAPVPPCPSCGSFDVEARVEAHTYAPVYGTPVTYDFPITECHACTESFQDPRRKDVSALVREAHSRANQGSVGPMLDWLQERKYTRAYVERALSLPVGRIKEWEAGPISPEALALLRVVRTFPWVLRIMFKLNFTDIHVVEESDVRA